MSESPKVFESLYLAASDPAQPPSLKGDQYLIDGELRTWAGKTCPVYSPIWRQGASEPTTIGSYPMMNADTAVEAVNAAVKAYDHGRGVWPRMTPKQRIDHVEKYLAGLRAKRDEIVNLLMWEICKNAADAAKEVDRTIKYVEDTVKAYKDLENGCNQFKSDSGIVAQIRRAPIGVVLCCGPFNYPFNETYTTLIPAILMGNTVVMKLPRVGVLCHFPTMALFKDCFPPGVVNIVSGSGRDTMPPIMKTGKIDIFAFIGTSSAADDIQKAHPKPHRLRVCLGLEAKNPGIILPDADLDVAVAECILGSLSFNGQRCTALKLLFVHESIADEFVKKFSAAVDAMKMGLPWEKGVMLTPLPEPGKPAFIKELVDDALKNGAKIVNQKAAIDRTFVFPHVLFPVNSHMKVYHEEQFGPVIPIATFKDIPEIFEYIAESNYGQQASVFSRDHHSISQMIDVLVNQVARVNINTQCQRGPDSLPFTGRKDSAYGTLSITDALRVFSIRSFVATKDIASQTKILTDILESGESNFLRMDYHF